MRRLSAVLVTLVLGVLSACGAGKATSGSGNAGGSSGSSGSSSSGSPGSSGSSGTASSSGTAGSSGSASSSGSACAATAFASTPADFALPPGYSPPSSYPFSFPTISGTSQCISGGATLPNFSVLDLDGDGHLDFVVTRHCSDTTVGNTKWLLYKGGPSGFASTPSDFALPPGYVPPSSFPFAFPLIGGTSQCISGGASLPNFSVLDLDGDGHLDFVVTRHCSDTTVGNTQWYLYKGKCP